MPSLISPPLDFTEQQRSAPSRTLTASTTRLWCGRILSDLPALFLLLDAAMKLWQADAAVKAITQLGYPISTVVPMGIILLAAVAAYLLPQTCVLGAILLTAYLGGAVASHVRLEQGPIEVLLPIAIATMLWGGLALRLPRVSRAIFEPH